MEDVGEGARMESTPLKNIKALTMVRNDRFLRRWVEYYGRELGRENLYVYFDGEDQEIPQWCEGVNAFKCKKMPNDVVSNDRGRARFLSERAAELMRGGADMVIGTDADEYIVVDPELGVGLREYLSRLPHRACWSPLGVDVIQQLDAEPPLDFNQPFLSQRHKGWLYSRYTKASIISEPVVWGSGFHRVKGHDLSIVKDLYLFHFGAADLDRLVETSQDPSRMDAGWNRHQLKRQRAIEKINRTRELPWNPTSKWARWVQTVCRPIYSPNKPTTFGVRYVVRIPDRFNECV